MPPLPGLKRDLLQHPSWPLREQIAYWEARAWMSTRKRKAWLIFDDDFVDYALGHAPGESDGLPALSVVGGVIHLSYTQNLAADDVELAAQWSGDLVNWHSLDTDFSLTALTSIAGGRQTAEFVSLPTTFSSNSQLFIRLTAVEK